MVGRMRGAGVGRYKMAAYDVTEMMVVAASKVLGDGKIERPVTVKATAFSVSATEKITAAGGKTEVL